MTHLVTVRVKVGKGVEHPLDITLDTSPDLSDHKGHPFVDGNAHHAPCGYAPSYHCLTQ